MSAERGEVNSFERQWWWSVFETVGFSRLHVGGRQCRPGECHSRV